MAIGASEAWIGVIGALGGVVVTGLIGLATAVLNHRWTRVSAQDARRYELRDKRAELRREAYTRYLRAVTVVVEEVATWEPPDRSLSVMELLDMFRRAKPECVIEYDASQYQARLLASEPVLRAIDTYHDWFTGRVPSLGAHAWQQPPAEEPNWAESSAQEAVLMDVMRAEQEADLGA